MDTASIEFGGVVIQAPVTAGTNLLLAVQCAVYCARLRTGAEARPRLWAGFFAMMSLATLAGVLKHGMRDTLPESVFLGVLWISSVTGGVSTYYAQLATIRSHAGAAMARVLSRAALVQLAGFLATSAALGPEMTLLIADTAIGLLPVIWFEARGCPEGGLVAIGLAVSIGTAAVYLSGLSVGPWLNHIDIAHVLMGVSFLLIARGARAMTTSPGGAPWS
jgi:hypothetical protein